MISKESNKTLRTGAECLKIGIDNYGLFPLGLSPLEILEWAKNNGAEGVHFSGLDLENRNRPDRAELKDLALYARENNLYLEWGGGQHIPYDTAGWIKRDIMEVNQRAAEEAELLGTGIVRSCSGGQIRWQPGCPPIQDLLAETASSLLAQSTMLRDHGVILALEIHFEFTTFELLRLFEMCRAEPGDYLGICLDTMNLLVLLEDPLPAVERILPWVVCTHIKDGGLLEKEGRLVVYPTDLGTGVIPLKEIAAGLSKLPFTVTLSVERHGGSFDVDYRDGKFLSKLPDLSEAELSSLIRMSNLCARSEPRMISRSDWPAVCEENIAGDVEGLKSLLRS
jgi:sugar phosphate isomerase/epimerase